MASAYIKYSEIIDTRNNTGKKKTKSAPPISDPIKQIVKAGILKNRVVVFGYRRSTAFSHASFLYDNHIDPYFADPVKPGYDNPPKLFSYNYAIIVDALEYIPEMMGRANLIKEALVVLKGNQNHTFVVMIAKTPEMVNKLAIEKKYEKTEKGFLIPEKPKSIFSGLTINGIDPEELITTAYFAGADVAEIDSDVETNMTCVRAYPNKKAAKKHSKLFEKAQVSAEPEIASASGRIFERVSVARAENTFGSTSTSSY